MQRKLEQLREQKKQLKEIRGMLDKDASLQTWEGMAYAQTLVKLVLIELEIEEIEKEKPPAKRSS